MKLSFSTLGCPSWTLARVIDAAGRYGYDGIELRFLEDDDALWARPELLGAGLAETLRRLADAGLVVSCVDSRSFFHHPDAGKRATALDEAARTIDLAAALSAPGIRVFGDRVQPGADRASTEGWIADALRSLAERGRQAGVECWLETHGDFATGAAARGVLDKTAAPGAAAIWDPANAFSEFGEAPADGARALGDAVRHVHLKDVVPPRSEGAPPIPWTPVLMGRGEFPAEDVLDVLARRGYAGFVSFEWEKRWHPEIEEPEIALPHFIRYVSQRLRGEEIAPAAPRHFNCGRLAVEVHPDRPAVGRASARLVSDEIRRLLDRDGRAAVIFASAPSQNEFLAELRGDAKIDWPRVTAFHLDEYAGVSKDHPASFRRFLQERLFDHVPVAAFNGLDGEAADLDGEARRYAELLRRERPQLAILGIGENGHLAFIDPPCCDFREPLDVRVVTLDEVCRQQQVNDGSFARLEDVPRRALSLSIPFLMRVPTAVAIVPGPAKRKAIAEALQGPVTCACPASILRRHPRATLFLDEASAAGLTAPEPTA
jgi:glucosamine-6-phosphate deaminase